MAASSMANSRKEAMKSPTTQPDVPNVELVAMESAKNATMAHQRDMVASRKADMAKAIAVDPTAWPRHTGRSEPKIRCVF